MALAYPNDNDGGAMRLAAIKNLERKLAMAERNNDQPRIDTYRQELSAAKEATKPLAR